MLIAVSKYITLKKLNYFNSHTLRRKKVFWLVINEQPQIRWNYLENAGENQFRYDFYRGILFTVAILGFFHTYPGRQSDMVCISGILAKLYSKLVL